MADRKFQWIRFPHPVFIDGLGATDYIDLRPDPDTKKAPLEGVSITWLAEDRLLKVVTRAGETLLNPAGWSGKRKFEDLTAKAKK